VATDIAARGIDVLSISHVINYDMPDTADAYTHRIGRTGRAEQAGEAFSLFTPADVDTLRSVERLLGRRLERRTVPGFDYRGPGMSRSSQPDDEPERNMETRPVRSTAAPRPAGLKRTPHLGHYRSNGRPTRSTPTNRSSQPTQ
jgi:ATP-dependent RNA helicase RhlE